MAKTINMKDFTKQPYTAESYADMRGVVDFGNLMQFAPYESGYSFVAVINPPFFVQKYCGTDSSLYNLQEAFIKIIEQEFKGLSGIDNITAETMDYSDGISTMSLLGKVTQPANSTISMNFTEKSGQLITKYISEYLRYIRDPRTEVKTYGGKINAGNAKNWSPAHEVFNMLYIITDSTCYNIEKAFLLLNAQPTEASYSDLYNFDKGDISTKEISVSWNAFVQDGVYANKLALVYMRTLLAKRAILLNSYDYDWSISGVKGKDPNKISKLGLQDASSSHPTFNFNVSGSDSVSTSSVDDDTYQIWTPTK